MIITPFRFNLSDCSLSHIRVLALCLSRWRSVQFKRPAQVKITKVVNVYKKLYNAYVEGCEKMDKSINPKILAYGSKPCPECGLIYWDTDEEASYIMSRLKKDDEHTINPFEHLKVDVLCCKNCGYTKIYIASNALNDIKGK